MSNFTYQGNPIHNLETYEWDNIWWEHAENADKERVLIVGDSISCGYRTIVNQMLNENMYADGFGTSKACDNKQYISAIRYVISQQSKKPKKILFNNGLHGWHLSTEEYKKHYNNLVEKILNEWPEIELILMLSTPTKNNEKLKVIERNCAVIEIANQYNLKVIDLYNEIFGNEQLISQDDVHLIKEGYEKLARLICKYII